MTQRRGPTVAAGLRRAAQLAAQRLAQEKPGQTLQATALVHEAYLRLVDVERAEHWNGRGHFFAAAAEAMRRILIENARRKQAAKAGGGRQRLELLDAELAVDSTGDELFAVDEALSRLAEEHPRAARLVHLRFFLGQTLEEAAAHLGLQPRTAYRDWAYARAWLRRELDRGTEAIRSGKSVFGFRETLCQVLSADFALTTVGLVGEPRERWHDGRARLVTIDLPEAIGVPSPRTAPPISTKPVATSQGFGPNSMPSWRHTTDWAEEFCVTDQGTARRRSRRVGCAAAFPGSSEAVGAVLAGPYKLIEQIGEGGMGSVWMAQQTEPVKRLVAVKLIKAGMDSRQVIARFEAERQALALMDHPNIARVLDAGTTERRPAVLRHGSRQGRADHPLLRRAPPHAAAAAGTVHPGLPGGAARASEGHHPPRPQAVQRAGRPL